MRGRRRVGAALGGAALALAAVSTLAACGTASDAATTPPGSSSAAASPAPSAPVLGEVGDISIAAGYVPAPASPDVASAYFTVLNSGSIEDTMVSATSDASETATMHRTEGGTMVPVERFVVPAGGSASFTAGADHLMLEGLTRPLEKGGRVTLTLTFATAGTVTVTVPVTGYPTGGTLPSEALTPLAAAS